MPSRSTLARLILPLFVLMGLACGPCNLLSGEVPTPSQPVAISTEAAGQLESRLQQSLQGQPGQEFIVRMTDDELSSLLSVQLAKYDESPVTNPQVWFTRGKVYGSGRLVNVLPVETEFYFEANARVQDGKVVVDMEKVSAGALPIPKSVLNTLSESINQTVEEAQLGVQVTALEILEGEIVVRGVKD